MIMPEQPVNHLDQSTVPVNPSVPATETPEDFDLSAAPLPQSLPPDRVSRLYQAVGFLAGISILLLGVISGFTIWLLLKQSQLEQQVEALSALTPEIERIRGIETQVKTLNQQIKGINQRIPQGLANQLKTTETELSNLKKRLAEIESDVSDNDLQNNALEDALKSLPSIDQDNNAQEQ